MMRIVHVDYLGNTVVVMRPGKASHTHIASAASLSRVHRFFWKAGPDWAMIRRDDRVLRFSYCEVVKVKP